MQTSQPSRKWVAEAIGNEAGYVLEVLKHHLRTQQRLQAAAKLLQQELPLNMRDQVAFGQILNLRITLFVGDNYYVF